MTQTRGLKSRSSVIFSNFFANWKTVLGEGKEKEYSITSTPESCLMSELW